MGKFDMAASVSKAIEGECGTYWLSAGLREDVRYKCVVRERWTWRRE